MYGAHFCSLGCVYQPMPLLPGYPYLPNSMQRNVSMIYRFFDCPAGLCPRGVLPESVLPAIQDARSKFCICDAVFVVPDPRTPFFCISSNSSFISGSTVMLLVSLSIVRLCCICDVLFSINLGIPNIKPIDTTAIRIMGFFRNDIGETRRRQHRSSFNLPCADLQPLRSW